MGHYDSSRPGYCPRCGAAPGNMRVDGTCEFCATLETQGVTPDVLARRRMTVVQATELAIKHAKTYPQSYVAGENFIPHEWVVRAILEAANGVQ
jgi:hypothetical protein